METVQVVQQIGFSVECPKGATTALLIQQPCLRYVSTVRVCCARCGGVLCCVQREHVCWLLSTWFAVHVLRAAPLFAMANLLL
jgi:hypothetical protein